MPSDIRIVVRVYANVKGLADVCTKADLITSPSMMEDFTRGFTRGKMLFDFVDVGYGKDRADGKVAGKHHPQPGERPDVVTRRPPASKPRFIA